MTWWTDIRDKVEKAATLGMYDPAQSRADERSQRQMINNQINAYKEQTALTRQQLDATRAAENVEKRRVEEKQIRSLRRNYRTQGLSQLGEGTPATADMNTQLGG